MSYFGLVSFDDTHDEMKVRKYPGDEFGDSPDEHRWRAWWDRDGVDGKVRGISLRCYPVTKITPCGAWVDPTAWTQHGRDGIEWHKMHAVARWVSNDGGAAWAKRTQEEALRSLAVRHARWSRRIINDANYFIEASKALKELMPDRAWQADQGMRDLAEFVAGCANDNTLHLVPASPQADRAA